MVSSGGKLVAHGLGGTAYIPNHTKFSCGDTAPNIQQSSGHQAPPMRQNQKRLGKGSCAIFSWRLGAENVQVHVLLSRQFGRSCAQSDCRDRQEGTWGRPFYTPSYQTPCQSQNYRDSISWSSYLCNPSMLNKTLALTVKLFIILFIIITSYTYHKVIYIITYI